MKNNKNLTFYFFVLILFTSCSSQNENFQCYNDVEFIHEEYDYSKLNPTLVKKDLSVAKALNNLLLNHSQFNILDIISIEKNHNRIKLDNKHYLVKGGFGLEYVTFYYEYVFDNQDALISYKLSLVEKKFLYLKHFEVDLSNFFYFDRWTNTYIYIYNISKVSSSIINNNYKGKLNYKQLEYYMSPYSGVRYGCRGGYANQFLKNRCAFNQLEYKQDLKANDLIYIMHSINLASRLTAIEYYTRHIDRFSKEEQVKIEGIIKTVFSEFGDTKIDVLEYDMGYQSTIEEAVNKQLENDCF